jgi:hypothetical protein
MADAKIRRIRVRRKKPFSCRHCKREFLLAVKGQKYCSDACRVWSKVDVRGPEECWPHTSPDSDGYGRLVGPWGRLAHRAAYWVANSCERLDGVVCHHCDNPPCCNPKHLYEGTMLDNARDRDTRGRANSIIGDRSGRATITNEQAKAIAAALAVAKRGPSGRLLNGEADRIAAEHGAPKRTVQTIDYGRCWGGIIQQEAA